MKELEKRLHQILKEIEIKEGISLKAKEKDYLRDYFQGLNRMPSWPELLTYAYEKKGGNRRPTLIEGHKIDAFYPQSNVINTKEADSLAIPQTPSVFMESKEEDEKVFTEWEARRARYLRASSVPLPREVITVIENQYLMDHLYTDKGYHHYQHEEGKSLYLTSFDLSDLVPVLSSKGAFSVFYSLNAKEISDESLLRKNNEKAFPVIFSLLRGSNCPSRVYGGFANTLPQMENPQLPQPGDVLVLLQGKNETDCQWVISAALALGGKNPVSRFLSLEHRSLSNAIFHLLKDSKLGCGVDIQLHKIPGPLTAEDTWLKPLENSYVLVVSSYQRHVLKPLIEREACPYKEIGQVTEWGHVVVWTAEGKKAWMDIPYEFFLPSAERISHLPDKIETLDFDEGSLLLDTHIVYDKDHFSSLLEKILGTLSCSDHSFLITQMDRSSTGCVTRDRMVGPWQVPVADVGVTVSDFKDYRGEAISIGECSGGKDLMSHIRIALCEAITNISAAAIENLSDVHLAIPESYSASCGKVLKDLCEALKISLEVFHYPPAHQAPLLFAFSPVIDVRKTLTPQFTLEDETELLGIFLEKENTDQIKSFFKVIQTLNANDLLLAYHDISSGGLVLCLLEMAFASQCGLSATLPDHHASFKKEPGVVLQVRHDRLMEVMDFLDRYQLKPFTRKLGKPQLGDEIIFYQQDKKIYSGSRVYLHRLWSKLGYEVQKEQINEVLAKQAYDALLDEKDPGLHETLTFDPGKNMTLPYMSEPKPPMAILRFPGSTGHLEIAAAFDRAGFECVDVQITDILRGHEDLSKYKGLAVGGSGWDEKVEVFSRYVLDHPLALAVFEAFFKQEQAFTLGIGSGFQWLVKIKSLIPGTEHWPILTKNASGRFESRWSLIKIQPSASIFLKGMEGSFIPLPIVSWHGRVEFPNVTSLRQAKDNQMIALCHVNHEERVSENYPFNPTGSPLGICGVSNLKGNVLGMVGHPERACRTVHQSWHYRYLQADAPWLRLFRNARVFI